MLLYGVTFLFLQIILADSQDLGWTLQHTIDGPDGALEYFSQASFDLSENGDCLLSAYSTQLGDPLYAFDLSGANPSIDRTITSPIGSWSTFDPAYYGQIANDCSTIYQLAPSNTPLFTGGSIAGAYFKINTASSLNDITQIGDANIEVSAFDLLDYTVNSDNLLYSVYVDNVLPSLPLEINNYRLNVYNADSIVVQQDEYLGEGFKPVTITFDEESKMLVTLAKPFDGVSVEPSTMNIHFLDENDNLVQYQSPLDDAYFGGSVGISKGGRYIVVSRGAIFYPDSFPNTESDAAYDADKNGFAVFARTATNFYSRVAFIEATSGVENGDCVGNNMLHVTSNGYIFLPNYDEASQSGSKDSCTNSDNIIGDNGHIDIYHIDPDTFVTTFVTNITSPEPSASVFDFVYFGWSVDTDRLGEKIVVSCPGCNSQLGRVYIYEAQISVTTQAPTPAPTDTPTTSPTKAPTDGKNLNWSLDETINATFNGGVDGCLFGQNSLDLSSDGSCLMIGNDAQSAFSCTESYFQIYSFDISDVMSFERKRTPQDYTSGWANYIVDKPGQIANNCNDATFLTAGGAPPTFDPLRTAFIQVDTSLTPASAGEDYFDFSSSSPGTMMQSWTFNEDLTRVFVEVFNSADSTFTLRMYTDGFLMTTFADYLGSDPSNNPISARGLLFDEESNRLVVYSDFGLKIFYVNDVGDIEVYQSSVPDAYDGQTIAFSSTGKYIAIAKGDRSTSVANGIALFREAEYGSGEYIRTAFFEEDFNTCIGNGGLAVSDLGYIAVSSFDSATDTGADCSTVLSTTGENGHLDIYAIDRLSNTTDNIYQVQTFLSPESGNTYFGESMDADKLMYRIAVGCPKCGGGENGQVFVYSAAAVPPTSAPTTQSPTPAPTSKPTSSPTVFGGLGWVEEFTIDASANGGSNGCWFGNDFTFLTDDGACILGNYDTDSPTCTEVNSAVNTYYVGNDLLQHLYYSPRNFIKVGAELYQDSGFLSQADCTTVTWITDQVEVAGGVQSYGSMVITDISPPASDSSAPTGSIQSAISVDGVKYGNNGNNFFGVLEYYDSIDTDEPRFIFLIQGGLITGSSRINNYLNSTTDRAVSIQVDQHSLHVFILSLESGLRVYRIDNGNTLTLVQEGIIPYFDYDSNVRMSVSAGGTYIIVAKGGSTQGDTSNGFVIYKRVGVETWEIAGDYTSTNSNCVGNGDVAVSENGYAIVGSYDLDDTNSADCGSNTDTEGNNGLVELFRIDNAGDIFLVQTIPARESGAVYFGKHVDIDQIGERTLIGCPLCDSENGRMFTYKAQVEVSTGIPTNFPTRAPVTPTNEPTISPTISPTTPEPTQAPVPPTTPIPSKSPSTTPTNAPVPPTTPTTTPPTPESDDFCDQMSVWNGEYDPWTIPNQLIPFTLVVYGLKWYYVLILFYAWESFKAVIMCGQNDFYYEDTSNVLISDPFMAITGVIVALVITWHGTFINKKVFDEENTRKDNGIALAEMTLIILSSFIFNPALLFKYDDFTSDLNKAFLFVLLGCIYILLCWRYGHMILSTQTACIILYYTSINIVVYFTTNTNSMWLSFIIAYAIGIPVLIIEATVENACIGKRLIKEKIIEGADKPNY